MRQHFSFAKGWTNLNHGSFGTIPLALQEQRESLQRQSEERPDAFIRKTYPTQLSEARTALASLLHVPACEVVLVPNTTTGINTVLRSLGLVPGERMVYFDCIYPACERTLEYLEESTGAVAVRIPLPFQATDVQITSALRETIRREQAAGERRSVRVAIFDTITGMPGVRLPFEYLVEVCREEGVLSLVDGAHGVGHIPLDLGELGADFFVSNCHKWLYVPRGCAVLHVPARNQPSIRSALPTSYGYVPRPGSSVFVDMFEFVGTMDVSSYLAIPAAIAWRRDVCGGEDAIMKYCWRIGRAGADLVAERLKTEVMKREGGEDCALWNVKIPICTVEAGACAAIKVAEEDAGKVTDFMTSKMVDEYNTYIALVPNYQGHWWARFSGQIYLELKDFEFAARVLHELVVRAGNKEYLMKEAEARSVTRAAPPGRPDRATCKSE
jgi:selenocysteine lyase/cysteine desulfurase